MRCPAHRGGDIRMRVSPMSDPIIARRCLERAARARAIVEDELVVEVFARLESRLIEGWAASRPDEAAAREEAYRSLRALQDFKAAFERLLSDGKVAERDLMDIKARQSKIHASS